MPTVRFHRDRYARVLRVGGVHTFLRAAMRLKHGIDVGPPLPPFGEADRPWSDEEVARVIALVENDAEGQSSVSPSSG